MKRGIILGVRYPGTPLGTGAGPAKVVADAVGQFLLVASATAKTATSYLQISF